MISLGGNVEEDLLQILTALCSRHKLSADWTYQSKGMSSVVVKSRFQVTVFSSAIMGKSTLPLKDAILFIIKSPVELSEVKTAVEAVAINPDLMVS
jgi:hypothetical protein